jgi:hypothetical protein
MLPRFRVYVLIYGCCNKSLNAMSVISTFYALPGNILGRSLTNIVRFSFDFSQKAVLSLFITTYLYSIPLRASKSDALFI